jgi:chromosome segregation ATPase
VQEQSRSRNLFREHADGLRDGINALFEDLKQIRNRVQGELHEASQKIYDEFNSAVDAVEAKLENSNTRVAALFDELKQLQQKYRDSKFTNEHRNKFFSRIDEAFKKVKERRFGGSADDGSAVERHNRRLTGLHEAIKRMQHTIKLDEEDLAFQQKKVNSTEGQLEAQIRMAKIKMIEERLAGKREKLADMQQTIADIERQIGRAKEGEQKRAERVAKQQRLDEAKEAAKNEIAKDIRTRGKGDGKEEDNIFEAAGTVLGDVLMDALDTMKAVASVMADKAEDAMEDVAKKVEEVAEVIMKKEDEAPAKTSTEETVALESTGASDTGDNIIEDVVHKGVAEAEAKEDEAVTPENKKDEADA